MGITYVDGAARGPTGEEAEIRFLLDSGATYSLLPESVWRPIGLEPTREMTFTLVDGTRVKSTYFPVLPCPPSGRRLHTGDFRWAR